MDIAAQNASLDNDYGTTRGPNAADSHELALFDGNPKDGAAEIDVADAPGYARVTVLPADWLAAADGEKLTVPLEFPDATAEWTVSPTHGGLIDPVTGDLWDSNPLLEPLLVTEAGPFKPAIFAVSYAERFDL